jgi:hypothetical protein
MLKSPMKKTMLLVLFMASTVCVAQNPSQEQAEDYMHKMEAWQDRDVTINDSLYKLLDGHSKRDIVVKGRDIYKIMFVKETPQYSASYIFLDGSKLSLPNINRALLFLPLLPSIIWIRTLKLITWFLPPVLWFLNLKKLLKNMVPANFIL